MDRGLGGTKKCVGRFNFQPAAMCLVVLPMAHLVSMVQYAPFAQSPSTGLAPEFYQGNYRHQERLIFLREWLHTRDAGVCCVAPLKLGGSVRTYWTGG